MRRTPLTRKTRLRTSKGPLEVRLPAEPVKIDRAAAAKALQHREVSLNAPRVERGPVAPVSRPAPKVTGAFPAVVRQTILDRDHYRCQRCGANVDAGFLGYSLQHRIARGSGGTSDPIIARPSNGLTLCGSATTDCHGWVESHNTEAERNGWAVASWADPTSVPVKTMDGWVLLNDRGTAWPTATPPGGDAHAVAQRRIA